MGEAEALTQLDVVLKRLAQTVVAAVPTKPRAWDQDVISVKWADTTSGHCDIIVASVHGTSERYHSPPMTAIHVVTELSAVQRRWAKPWDELLLRVGSDGTCQVEFGYPKQGRDAEPGAAPDPAA